MDAPPRQRVALAGVLARRASEVTALADHVGHLLTHSSTVASADVKMSAVKPLGLIAGEGVFPMLVARGARRAGRRVVCAALAGSAWPELRDECDVFKWVGVLR